MKKTIQEILEKKGITETTKHHSYGYLYKQMVLCGEQSQITIFCFLMAIGAIMVRQNTSMLSLPVMNIN
jgi:hypothetical protein